GTLRYAINQANTDAANGTSDTIVFNTAQMGGSTVTLQQGQLKLKAGAGTTAIDGGGLVTVNGNNASRVFLIDGGAQALLSNLTIANGTPGESPGNPVNGSENGGGIENFGTLTVCNATLTGNAAYFGGGIENFGTLTVRNATLAGNATRPSGPLHSPSTA